MLVLNLQICQILELLCLVSAETQKKQQDSKQSTHSDMVKSYFAYTNQLAGFAG